MSYLFDNWDQVLDLTVRHLWLSVIPIVLGFVVAVPIGWYANRHRRLRGALLSLGSILYTVPSLALFVLLPAMIGTQYLDPLNVVIALTMYAIALMVRSATDGFASVSPEVLDAATANGYAPSGRAFAVELPLAGPVLLAGLRVVAVSTVSLVSVGALTGVSNLGSLFTNGFQRGYDSEIFTGVVAIVVIALLLDGLLVVGGRLLMPWSVERAPRREVSVRPRFVQHLRGGRA